MLILKLALRNILGAGLRTWLNVIVLSFSFVIIIWLQGFYIGMLKQVSDATIDAEYGGGQYWHPLYDPFDPLSLQDAHAPVEGSLKKMIEKGKAIPILVTQGTLYPSGRIMPVLLKGINPEQTVLSLPSHLLDGNSPEFPVLIGTRMAGATGFKEGDIITVQWRDSHGTFDALDGRIVKVMETIVPTIDGGQLWIPLERLREMTLLPGEATLVVIAEDVRAAPDEPGWSFKNQDFLLSDIRKIVQIRTIGSSFIYAFLLLLAMLAIFNTQVLSIFRRRKEMGTLMALGVTRTQIIELFTLEGAFHGLLAALVAAVYGIPLFVYSAKGIGLPSEFASSTGFAIGARLFPSFTAALVAGTTLVVLIITTIVSYLPTRRIAKLKPTDALRGKLP